MGTRDTGGGGGSRHDLPGGNWVRGEISVHVSVLFFFAQNKPVNNSSEDFCGSNCISKWNFVDRSHGLFDSVTSGGSKNTGSAKCDRWRSPIKIVLCPCCTNMCWSRRSLGNPSSLYHYCVMDKKEKCWNLSVHFPINTLRRGYWSDIMLKFCHGGSGRRREYSVSTKSFTVTASNAVEFSQLRTAATSAGQKD
jgi:hypothetical protein